MTEPASQGQPRRTWTATLFGIGGSLLAHAAIYALISWVGVMPQLDFELKLPMEADFGLTEPVATSAPLAPATEPAVAPTPTEPANGDVVADSEKPKPEKKPKPENKPEPDASTPSVADAGTPSEDRADAGAATEGDALAGFAPSGTQLSLRIHMARIRESELVNDVRQLLAAVPDWRLILEDSQIDPVADLDRLLLASPDLRREKLVIAGEYSGGSERVHLAVANMANARGKSAEWTLQGNVEVAPWHNEDATERVIALVGPQQFVICRPEDLPRIIAVARGLAERAKEQTKEDATPDEPSAAEALLGMEEDEVLSLSVEGARQFVPQRVNAVPTRLSLGARPNTVRKIVKITISASYDDEAQAIEAKRYWDAQRNRFGSHPLVALMGMSSPLMNARIEVTDALMTGHSELNFEQVRMLLGFVRSALTPPPLPPALPPPLPTPITPPPSPTATPQPPSPAP